MAACTEASLTERCAGDIWSSRLQSTQDGQEASSTAGING
jgi:hypothetical protein